MGKERRGIGTALLWVMKDGIEIENYPGIQKRILGKREKKLRKKERRHIIWV